MAATWPSWVQKLSRKWEPYDAKVSRTVLREGYERTNAATSTKVGGWTGGPADPTLRAGAVVCQTFWCSEAAR